MSVDVSCDGCGWSYPADEMRVVTLESGLRAPWCGACIEIVGHIVSVEPYVAPVLPGQRELPQALSGYDALRLEGD